MLSRPILQLGDAERAIAKLFEAATADGGAPVVAAVCDEHGELILLKRMDGAPFRSVAIAQNKAYTAARAHVDTAALEGNLRKAGRQVTGYADPRFTDFPGGVVLKAPDGTVLGALGISGRSLDDDHQLALLGRSALELDHTTR